MCGFIGKIGEADPENLRRGLPWICRRGPDSQRLWSTSNRRASILFARLAIVDKDPRAHQPLIDPPTGVAVGMVGEIYNYRELQPLFSGYRFETEADTELILAAYAARGVEGFGLFKGMFAFVLVDEKRGKIFLVRDAVGKKPLLHARWGSEVYFGSSLLPLVAAHGGNVAVETAQPAHYWRHGFVHPGTSALAGARPVLPGQLLEFDDSGRLVAERRCEPKAAKLFAGEDIAGVRVQLGGLIETAVKRRLSNNPHPLVLLSGGIDSTLVTKVALRAAGAAGEKKLEALTLGSLIPMTYDERYARYAAGQLRVPLKVLRPSLGKISDVVIRSLDLQDEPLGMPSYFLLERLTAVAAQHGRVLLSGEGGDEFFLGYGRPADWLRDSGSGIRDSLVPCGPPLPEWMSAWARNETTNTLVGHMFAKADRATAEQAVELRCPLLDWDVISYARSLPFEILARNGSSKALLKDQLSEWPDWFLSRPKAGFTYNLRWLWALRGYAGLRENIEAGAVEQFEPLLPCELRKPAADWRAADIFSRFDEAWRLLAWSRFLARLKEARRE